MKLIQEDCLKYLKSLDDKSVDVIVTDPPYGLGEWVGKKKSRGKHVSGKEWGTQSWDDKTPDREYFSEILRVSKNQVIFGGNYFAHLLPPSPAWLVWDKQNTGNFADVEMAWTSFTTAARIFKYRWNGMFQGTIADKRMNEKRVHPTQKPLPLMEWVIQNYTKEGDTILDPFMGSGTTGVACVNFNRDFIGVEKENQFFNIAKNRIEAAESQITF